MKRLLLITIIILLNTGCSLLLKNQKREDRQVNDVTVSNNTINATQDAHTQTKKVTTKKTNVADKSITTAKEISYSKPDAKGQQYKIIERIIERKNNVTKKDEYNELLLKTKEEQIRRIEEENKRMTHWMEEIVKVKQKTSTKPSWLWLVGVFLAGMVLGIIIWRQKLKLF